MKKELERISKRYSSVGLLNDAPQIAIVFVLATEELFLFIWRKMFLATCAARRLVASAVGVHVVSVRMHVESRT